MFFFLHRSSLLETNKFAKERSVENELEENNDENCDDAHDPINLADVKDETDGMNDENNWELIFLVTTKPYSLRNDLCFSCIIRGTR